MHKSIVIKPCGVEITVDYNMTAGDLFNKVCAAIKRTDVEILYTKFVKEKNELPYYRAYFQTDKTSNERVFKRVVYPRTLEDFNNDESSKVDLYPNDLSRIRVSFARDVE